MKKLFLVGALALFGAMNAQKNTLLVGGNISYDSTTRDITNGEVKDNEFSFNPTIGYQFADNWTAGVRLGIGTGKTTYDYTTNSDSVVDTEYKNTTFQYGVFGRYTLPLNDTFAVYGDLDVYANNGKYTTSASSVSSSYKTNGFGVAFTPNLFINFKNSFGLNINVGSLGYESSKNKLTDFKTNTFGFRFGEGVSIGISKNFKL